jgi:hypothetical protein
MTNAMPAAAPPPPKPSAARPAMAESASVTTSTTSTTFTIVGRQTIKADNTDVKVTVTQSELPVHLRYSDRSTHVPQGKGHQHHRLYSPPWKRQYLR